MIHFFKAVFAFNKYELWVINTITYPLFLIAVAWIKIVIWDIWQFVIQVGYTFRERHLVFFKITETSGDAN